MARFLVLLFGFLNHVKNIMLNFEVARSLFFIPGHIKKFYLKAIETTADILVLDFEDAVPKNLKNQARNNASVFLKERISNKPLLIRINPICSKEFEEDMKIALEGKADGIIIPKIYSADEIKILLDKIITFEKKNKTDAEMVICLMIETASAIFDLKRISKISKRIKALIFGHEDFLFDLDAKHMKSQENLLYARSQIVIAAKANNIAAIDTPFLDIKDSSGCLEHAKYGRSLGFEGMLVLHPNQVDKANEGYSPTQFEIEEANQIVHSAKGDIKNERTISFKDGKFIAPPIIKQAAQLLKRARQLHLID